jgi:thiamine-phosphate pyrophosphorylase
MKLPDPVVMLITDRSQARHSLEHIVSEACRAGCRWISIREKDLAFDELRVLFGTLRNITEKWGALIGIHGCAEDAQRLGADCLHLSAQDDARFARSIVGDGIIIGQSVHSAYEAGHLSAGILDYALAAPVFPTTSKPDYGPCLELRGMQEVIRHCAVPVLGLGGLNPDNISRVLTAGAAGIAIMGGMMRAKDPHGFFQTIPSIETSG